MSGGGHTLWCVCAVVRCGVVTVCQDMLAAGVLNCACWAFLVWRKLIKLQVSTITLQGIVVVYFAAGFDSGVRLICGSAVFGCQVCCNPVLQSVQATSCKKNAAAAAVMLLQVCQERLSRAVQGVSSSSRTASCAGEST